MKMTSKYEITAKDIIEKPEILMSGHRACAGCGAAIALRLVLKAVRGPTILTHATGCMEVVSTIYPYTAWKVPWIHTAFENVAANASGIETALKVLRRKGRIKDEHVDVIAFAGDGGTFDIGIQALSGAVERGHDFLYVLYDNEAYMNCLSRKSLIMTRDGLKKITEIKKGDEIYAFDQKSYQPVLKKCTGIFDNGTRDIYELETLHHSIKATSNHPFLVLKRNGRERTNGFVWKTLSEVRVGDEVVVLKNLDGGESFKFSFKKTRKEDCKVSHLNEVNIPERSSPEYPSQYRHQNFLIGNDHFEMEKVKCIRYMGEEPTLDLRVEGEHNFIADGIVVHNTGIQRSGGTPHGVATTTSPSGSVIPGKPEYKKPISDIMVAHGMPYVATASPYYWKDLITKARKGIEVDGPAFLHVIAPCPRGWRYDTSKTIEISRLAVETCIFPLWEAIDTEYQLSEPSEAIALKPEGKKPVREYLQMQGRFRHLFTPKFEKVIDEIQQITDKRWQRLLKKCGMA
jgi:pyruvate/2-oxoacid:ferredoxin oxidoreductase beta subunit